MASSDVAGLILAAGASTRFGSPKALAPLDGRPLLQHVLDTVAAAGLAELVVVLGAAADKIEPAIEWHGARFVRNPAPDRGLASSLQVGLAHLAPTTEAALILLGDQPRVRSDVLAALLEAADDPAHPVVVPRYAGGGGPNPLLIHRSLWHLADQAAGDRGLLPVIAEHRELVLEVPVAGVNPDIDTPADLAALEQSVAAADAARANVGADTARPTS